MLDQRVSDKMSGNGDVTIGSVWSAFIDFRKEVRDALKEGFEETHRKQDTTNGRLRWLERFSWTALGGVGVLTFLVGTFGVAILALR